jgi:hypothetical protein
MRYNKLLYLTFFLLLSVGVVKGQTINIQSDNVKWNANGLTDLNANVTVSHQCQFITYGNNKMDWVQSNGNFILHFTIISTTGDWRDPSNNGSIFFAINGEKLNGRVTISKSSMGITINLKLSGGTSDINLSYPISSYEKI